MADSTLDIHAKHQRHVFSHIQLYGIDSTRADTQEH